MSLEGSIIAVTGAGGFIGHVLCRKLITHGAVLRSLVRYRSETAGEYQFDLSHRIMDPAALQPPVRAVVHCAWDVKAKSLEDARNINVEGTQWLINRCTAAGVEQFVFISAPEARDDAGSPYGLSKWEVEKRLSALPDSAAFSTIIVPGIVIGKGGLFRKIRSTVKNKAIIPVSYGSNDRRIQTVYIDELCEAIIAAIVNRITGRVCVAEARGVTPNDFYRGLAMLEGKNPRLLPMPGDLALTLTRAAEVLGIKPTLTSDNLVEMKQRSHFDVHDSLATLGFPPISTYFQSLQRLAIDEGAVKVAEQIGKLSGFPN